MSEVTIKLDLDARETHNTFGLSEERMMKLSSEVSRGVAAAFAEDKIVGLADHFKLLLSYAKTDNEVAFLCYLAGAQKDWVMATTRSLR